jgi:hypothetical protein
VGYLPLTGHRPIPLLVANYDRYVVMARIDGRRSKWIARDETISFDTIADTWNSETALVASAEDLREM